MLHFFSIVLNFLFIVMYITDINQAIVLKNANSPAIPFSNLITKSQFLIYPGRSNERTYSTEIFVARRLRYGRLSNLI